MDEARVLLATVGALLPPPPPGTGGPFALSAPGQLEALLSSAGLQPTSADEVPTPFTFPDLETAVRANLASGPARRAIQHAGHSATEEAIRTALADSVQPDGSMRSNNAFRYVIATVPSS